MKSAPSDARMPSLPSRLARPKVTFIPARRLKHHCSRSPSSITWLPLFIFGLAVSPFHSSQMVVAPWSSM